MIVLGNHQRRLSLSRRKTPIMSEITGFLEIVVAKWLRKSVPICTRNDFNMSIRNAAEESAAFVTETLKKIEEFLA